MNFLQSIAADLLKRYGSNLSNITVVSPGKRAQLFMNQYLAQLCPTPVWTPRYTTIDELVQSLSPFHKADSITSVCTLYNIYNQLVPDAEPLDEFYGWGEIILSDFDDIDKHMAPAEKIFHNVYDIHSISEQYLTPEQEQALREFFKNFSVESNTELKRRFLRLWEIMPSLYTELNNNLRQWGLLYPGAQYRDVVERLKNATRKEDDKSKVTYVFMGFNILDESTEAIFAHYEHQHETLFYWDYDRYYVDDTMCEAGLFMRNNLKNFPNALQKEQFDNLRKLKDITYIATSTNNAQSRYIPTWLSNNLTKTENETAIILCDEHQLGSVLHCLPGESPKCINITMGYPLNNTPVFSFLSELMALYIDGYDASTKRYRYTFLEKVRHHPYYAFVDEAVLLPEEYSPATVLSRLIHTIDSISKHYAAKETPDVYDQLYIESLFQTHLTLTKFQQMVTAPDDEETGIVNGMKNIGGSTLRRLLRQVLSATSIPFHGEPAIGMQVMGLLESRNIDFKNILMLGATEGIMPKKNDDTSLIPYNLRESFGLTTIRHRVSVFAYYFFRLISRAEHVTLMYNENPTGGQGNEMSRFLRQLMSETELPIRFVRLMPSNEKSESANPTCVAKTDDMLNTLKEHYINNSKNQLSPTAINTLLSCSLQFYYKYVAKLRVEQNTEDGITPPLFGIIFHDAAHLLYNNMAGGKNGGVITSEMLAQVLESTEMRLIPFIDASLIINIFKPLSEEQRAEELQRIQNLSLKEVKQYVQDFYDNPVHKSILTGINHIVRNVLIEYLTTLVRYDKLHAPFTIVGLEKKYYYKLDLNENEAITTGGIIDRLERDSDGVLTVVDYKTGGKPSTVTDIEAIFKHKDKAAGYFLQTFIYALAASQKFGNEPCHPTLFYLNQARHPEKYSRDMKLGTATNNAPVLDVHYHAEDFCEGLRETINKLFSKEYPFEQTDNEAVCKYCDFCMLCKPELSAKTK